jgi:hypothetical protein
VKWISRIDFSLISRHKVNEKFSIQKINVQQAEIKRPSQNKIKKKDTSKKNWYLICKI